jgi:hypothetical protein
VRIRSFFTNRSRRTQGIGATVAAAGMIVAGIVASPIGAAHAESSCNLQSEHQANPDHYECHFVHFEVKKDWFGNGPSWRAEQDFYEYSTSTELMDYWKTKDDRPSSTTWTWDCAKEPVQQGEWPCTGSYQLFIWNDSTGVGKQQLTTDRQPLNTNHCFRIADGYTQDVGTSPENCS